MITSQQIRAARALLDLSHDQAAALAGFDRDRLIKAEDDKGEHDPVLAEALETAFMQKGVVFIEDGEGGGGPGVRLKHPIDPSTGIRPENLNSANDG